MDGLGSAVAGGIAGGLFAVAAVIVQNRLDRGVERAADRQVVCGYLQALKDEIETLWSRYLQTAGQQLFNVGDDKPFLVIYPVYQDFFSVYTGNTAMIGRVDDHDLRAQLVRAYTLARGFVDSFRLNNELYNRWTNTDLLYRQTGLPVLQQSASALMTQMTNYARQLKAGHQELDQEISELVRLIDGYLNRRS